MLRNTVVFFATFNIIWLFINNICSVVVFAYKNLSHREQNLKKKNKKKQKSQQIKKNKKKTTKHKNIDGSSQAEELQKKVPVRAKDRGPWEKPVRAFKSFCVFYKEASTEALTSAVSSILARPLEQGEERWLRTGDFHITDPKLVYGLLVSTAFVPNLVHGIEVNEVLGDEDIRHGCLCQLKYNSGLHSLILDGVAQDPSWGSLLFDGLNSNPQSTLRRFGLMNAKIGVTGFQTFTDNLQVFSYL